MSIRLLPNSTPYRGGNPFCLCFTTCSVSTSWECLQTIKQDVRPRLLLSINWESGITYNFTHSMAEARLVHLREAIRCGQRMSFATVLVNIATEIIQSPLLLSSSSIMVRSYSTLFFVEADFNILAITLNLEVCLLQIWHCEPVSQHTPAVWRYMGKRWDQIYLLQSKCLYQGSKWSIGKVIFILVR